MTPKQAIDTAAVLEIEQNRIVEDIEFFVGTALEAGGPVLDLGCGTGRIGTFIAQAGAEIVGLDISAPVLARFKQRLSLESRNIRKRVKLIQGDMACFSIKKRFGCIICSSNTLFLIGSEDGIVRTLACAQSHLQSGGTLIVDVAAIDLESRTALSEYPSGDFPDLELTGCWSDLSVKRTHSVEPRNDEVGQDRRCFTIRYKYFDAGDNLCFERLEMALLLTPQELISLMERLGYEIVKLFGWYDRREYKKGERKLIVVARRKELH